MNQIPSNNTVNEWPHPVRKDRTLVISVNRNIVLTLFISILLHLSLLWIFAPKLFSMGAPVENAPPLEITLGPPQKEQVAPSEEVLPMPEAPEKVPAEPVKRKPIRSHPPKQIEKRETPVEVVDTSDLKVQKNKKLNKKLPQPKQKELQTKPLPGEDMQAYVRRIQQAKLAKQGLSKQDVAAVMESNNPQSAGERRDAKIKANLDLDGTNGVFEIRSLGLRKATFSFKGWKNNINTARLEIFEVSAPDGKSIKLAVIRKMIAIIRRDYDGDFNWDSRRQHRVIVLSARPEDTAGLEAFMMNEFFGPGSVYR